MSKKTRNIFVGQSDHAISERKTSGDFVEIDGKKLYKISNYDQLPPFFMTLLSHSDHWLFISSRGSLTAGRKDPNQALFPYYTVDKIHDAADHTGSKSLVLIHKEPKSLLWEPFSSSYQGVYQISRNLYKNDLGNQILFEETNHDLELTFRYQWTLSEQFGFVRKSELINDGTQSVEIEILDGIQNILPYGVDRLLQQSYSNLADAYKKNERVHGTSIGLFTLSAIIVDRPEPSEALKAHLVWSVGLEDAKYLLSTTQVDAFKRGESITEEMDVRGTRGAYLIHTGFRLSSAESKTWSIIADTNKDAGQVALLKSKLIAGKLGQVEVQKDIDNSSTSLRQLLAKSDATQLTTDHLSINRHLSNVQFNVMRGGLFESNYNIGKADLIETWTKTNLAVVTSHQDFIKNLPDTINSDELLVSVQACKDPQLTRLCYEYLPLTFSRRHGDPSRPWNMFSIDVKKQDGSRNLNYEGNWRDIFQNWEALCLSFPEYTEAMITKFVNASTADGYNPYRITKDGIDWEELEPDNPWSNIGYWGDHQLIYLLRLLEISFKHHPEKLIQLLTSSIFCYANVPYRIKTYDQIVVDATNTIDYDHALDASILQRVQEIGSDGKLIFGQDHQVLQVNFTEKILVTLLAKLSNFVPEGGIWLNTQRPEWNDANNALVGNGVSMVTMYQLRRFVVFADQLVKASKLETVQIAEEVHLLYQDIKNIFEENERLLAGEMSDKNRKIIVDQLGQAGSQYRQNLYSQGFSESKQAMSFSGLSDFLQCALRYIDHSIRANKRPDTLYHSYNLIQIGTDAIGVKHLYEMLEGQVNVLSSGSLTSSEAVTLLDSLKQSALYREDQNSYILYPNRDLPRFEEKNIIPATAVQSSPLLTKLITGGNTAIAYQDVHGDYHFNGTFKNANDLQVALEHLPDATSSMVQSEREALVSMFENVFDHESFTGRSGTFFGYEGLGSIYWHMVSKLLLAVNETYFQAIDRGADKTILGKLVSHYYEIRAGIGLNKSPAQFGAFPTDAYSHTPEGGGAKQPGMTGQVKEDIIARFGELGVEVADGIISFNGSLLRKSEYIQAPQDFTYFDLSSKLQTIPLPEDSLAFTYCQTPIVYRHSMEQHIEVILQSDEMIKIPGNQLDRAWSQSLFERRFEINRILVFLAPGLD